jgi:YidC/Oxa1 family membrane protein insertase
MQQDNKNLFLAIGLSLTVLIGWNYFFGIPGQEEQRRIAEQGKQQQAQTAQVSGDNRSPGPAPAAQTGPAVLTREQAVASGERITIETPKLRGSLPLKGGEIDDIALKEYRETVDAKSANIVLLSPFGTERAYFAEFGWVGAPGASVALPGPNTVWTADRKTLTPAQPVTLSWSNGQGLTFKRTLSVDEAYTITVKDAVTNGSGAPLSLSAYGLVRRYGKPETQGFYILHEGLIGVAGESGLQEYSYDAVDKEQIIPGKGKGKIVKGAVGGFAGITDKYWAAVIAPDQNVAYDLTFSGTVPQAGVSKSYQADILAAPRTIAPGETAENVQHLYAGAKEVKTIAAASEAYGIKRFDLMIDWGWFYFITKPMFWLIDLFFRLTGNFGIAILLVTVVVKAIFYPLANKSYVSMAKMKAVQPAMLDIREKFANDKMAQQQAMMELYKREKINPLAGCLPVLVQIPVFFALYKVLFVTIEMRHAPFYGWIRDLAAPDPTSLFNLFGLIPWEPPQFLMLGIWPIIMGITMFVQMKMNPEPPDPIQKTMFTWMPVIFTFMLASFPAGLVIYWSWNNLLSVLQQYAIMKKQGVKVELWDNLRGLFGPRTKTS